MSRTAAPLMPTSCRAPDAHESRPRSWGHTPLPSPAVHLGAPDPPPVGQGAPGKLTGRVATHGRRG